MKKIYITNMDYFIISIFITLVFELLLMIFSPDTYLLFKEYCFNIGYYLGITIKNLLINF